jgi:hypothetical protein
MTTTNITSTDPEIAATERLYARPRRPRPRLAQRRRTTQCRARRLIHQLEQLGHTLTLEPQQLEERACGPSFAPVVPDSHLDVTRCFRAVRWPTGR